MPDVGRTLGRRYRLLELLGEGGMATIYRAHDTQLDRDVAVKVLRSDYGADPGFIARFRQEARAAASLSHPNVVSVYDYGNDQAGPFIVMELVDGQDLAELLRERGPLPPALAARIAAQVGSALQAAHARGIVHRDVKPSNVLVARDGRVRVADFGIARALVESQLTVPGTTLGSGHYFSPEQVRGDPVTPASDIYALGLVLYEALTGQRAWSGDSPAAAALARLTGQVPRASAVRPDIPPALDAIVARALAPDPAARFPSAAAMAEVLAGVGLEPVAPPGQPGEFPKAAGPDATAVAVARPLSSAPDGGGSALTQPPVAPAIPAVPPDSVQHAPATEAPHASLPPPQPGSRPSAGRLPTPLATPTGPALGTRGGIGSPPGGPTGDVPPGEEWGDGGRGSGAWAWAAGILGLLVLLLAGAAIYLVLTRTPPAATLEPAVLVPSFIGQTLADAQARAADAGLTVQQGATETGSSQPEGTIVDQNPDPGTPVGAGSVVTVTIAVGSGLVAVPDVTNQTEQQAVVLLVKADLSPGTRTEAYSAIVPEGSVISSNPTPGTQVPSGTAVSYVVSKGPELTPTPTVAPTPTPTVAPTPTPTEAPTPTPEVTPEPSAPPSAAPSEPPTVPPSEAPPPSPPPSA